MSDKKIRLDVAVFERGFAETREKAKAMIMAGSVYLNGQKALKGGVNVKETDVIEVRGAVNPYVSRGGLKLHKAVESFGLDLKDCVCMDIGASTGGFTDCMLINGAKKVYAIDVGYGQLAWKLRSDERVKNLEKTNIRNVTVDMLDEKINFFSVDVSFISLKHIFPVAYAISTDEVIGACLVKPQFEAGKEKVGKKGVVRDSEVHREVIENVIGMANENGFYVHNLTFSPIKGPEGNIEFLIVISKDSERETVTQQDIDNVVLRAKQHLGD